MKDPGEKIKFLETELEQERALAASLNRYIVALEARADFQRELIEALQQKIERLENTEN
jgi:ribosome-binding ATPase YchF (GTP1/OBG family)